MMSYNTSNKFYLKTKHYMVISNTRFYEVSKKNTRFMPSKKKKKIHVFIIYKRH